jgi:hypothetical protein
MNNCERAPTRSETPDLSSLGDLSADLARVWNSPATDSRLKKRLIRVRIDEIVVDLNAEPSMVELISRSVGNGRLSATPNIQRCSGMSHIEL